MVIHIELSKNGGGIQNSKFANSDFAPKFEDLTITAP